MPGACWVRGAGAGLGKGGSWCGQRKKGAGEGAGQGDCLIEARVITTARGRDKVTIVASPLKNGNPGGSVRSVVLADGKAVIGGEGGY